jgi:AbiTii
LREQSLSAPAPGDRVGALNENKSIGDLLRTVIQLGDEAKSTDLRDWALRELNDYGPDDELPPYRPFTAPAVLAAKGSGLSEWWWSEDFDPAVLGRETSEDVMRSSRCGQA